MRHAAACVKLDTESAREVSLWAIRENALTRKKHRKLRETAVSVHCMLGC